MAISTSVAVCVIAWHVGPADHLATYVEELTKRGYEVQIHATGPALKKFQERGIKVIPFSLDNLTDDEQDKLAVSMAKTCSIAPIIITDLGHRFVVKLQKAFKVHALDSFLCTYYDNPESFVPGEYSRIAAEAIQLADGILFANDNLAKAKIYSAPGKEIDFDGKKRFGIGYYPVNQAEVIAEKRKASHDIARSTFLKKNGLEDTGQEILVYIGGNNEEYFTKAFPAFLAFVAEASGQINLKNPVIVIQQHPGAKVKNLDGQQVEAWQKKLGEKTQLPKVVLSDFSSDDALVLADRVLYFQSSMIPMVVLAGISAIQIGHEIFDDVLVRNHLVPTVTNAEELTKVIGNLDKTSKMPQADLLSGLGIKEDWAERLEKAIKESIALI